MTKTSILTITHISFLSFCFLSKSLLSSCYIEVRCDHKQCLSRIGSHKWAHHFSPVQLFFTSSHAISLPLNWHRSLFQYYFKHYSSSNSITTKLHNVYTQIVEDVKLIPLAWYLSCSPHLPSKFSIFILIIIHGPYLEWNIFSDIAHVFSTIFSPFMLFFLFLRNDYIRLSWCCCPV